MTRFLRAAVILAVVFAPSAGFAQDKFFDSQGVRIRHFGLLANRQRAANLARCRQLLAVSAPIPTSVDPDAISTLLRQCPVCHVGHWVVVEVLPRSLAAQAPIPPDSS